MRARVQISLCALAVVTLQCGNDTTKTSDMGDESMCAFRADFLEVAASTRASCLLGGCHGEGGDMLFHSDGSDDSLSVELFEPDPMDRRMIVSCDASASLLYRVFSGTEAHPGVDMANLDVAASLLAWIEAGAPVDECEAPTQCD